MKTIALSETIFHKNTEKYFDSFILLMTGDSGLFLLVPLTFKVKVFLKRIKENFSVEYVKKINLLFRKLNLDNRIIRIANNYSTFCEIINSTLADYEFYNDEVNLQEIGSRLCINQCLAQKSGNGKSLAQLAPTKWTLSGLDITSQNSTQQDLKTFLESSLIRFTQTVTIIDPFLGEKIEENNYTFPPTLSTIYETFICNLKKYRDIWMDYNPSFIIHTPGNIQHRRHLSNIKHMKIITYRCSPRQFLHDRFLKTEYIFSQWGSGFDIFDFGSPKRATAISILENKRYRIYKHELEKIRRN